MTYGSPGIWSVYVEAPFGWVGIMASKEALKRVVFAPPVQGAGDGMTGAPAWLWELTEQMHRYFRGEQVDFRWVPVDIEECVGDFSKRVLKAAREIPYGMTATYGELASVVGSNSAARAVGGAMAANPVPIVIPCHRVLPKRGGVGGFSAGAEIKRRLLELEGVKI